MKHIQFILLLSIILFTSCGKETSEVDPGSFTVKGSITDFEKVGLNAPSEAQEINLTGEALTKSLLSVVTGDFEIAVDNGPYSKQATISANMVNRGVKLKVRCIPTSVGELNGILTISGDNLTSITYDLKAAGVEKLLLVSTFSNQRLAFGGGYSQKAEGSFTFNTDPEKVETITMYVKLSCPSEGCNAWDMYANIRLQDPVTEEWFEIGRFITPYGVDNSELPKGLPIDVTDFKSLLTGEVNLRSFIEVWGADGWLLSLDFEVIEGTPDYKYYAVAPLLDYAQHSLSGIPYGVQNDFKLDKCITIPGNAEETTLRTTISGWGHATPNDPDGRPCAEWCFRTHQVLIDENPLFEHTMKGIGCDQNPVKPQFGNWQPDRAGWCPGMEVPVRNDIFDYARAGESFCYKYQLEPWINDMQSTADNKNAYYAITSFIVVKSNTPIDLPVVG
ncbi:peptide-N-glycosidase F-related protein [Prolixibacteraceae bacterium Z1-6]|uniref:Peptide-N-glycosidase F-related protein n=1 Tax=Draconibacterium aestuarii TaxID=2998507 RepID=A0A9X3F9I5_9BACT|nr:peptide-N-glycosidase F-related protein [Prolixibacteraceae bacterium Z1-6]